MPYEHQLKTAISWVHANHALVASIAGPYRKHMASGGIGTNFHDIEQMPFTSQEQECEEIDHAIIEQALQTMTNRQRQISRWILSRATPVSTNLIAHEFGICGRTVRNIVCGAIKRVEENGKQNANPKICEGIYYTAKDPLFAGERTAHP